MKQKDVSLIIIIAFISALLSFFGTRLIFHSQQHTQKVEVVSPITADFQQPDTNYFNKDANDPTKLIQIGDNSNQTPFTSSTQ